VLADGDNGAFAFLDLMALRVPVVADNNALSQCYVADGSTGSLLPNEDPAEVASALAILLSGPAKRAAAGAAAHARVQREFSESAMIDGFERAVNVAGDRTTWPTS
jgi:glycosyltransferase involved in cell wall biosynthesis